ncbi:hypothetical protein ACFL17_07005 [Pseudomonadota bacterium]
MHIVYISVRPQVFQETVRQVERFMPFIDHVVVACPTRLAGEFAGSTTLPLTIFNDEQLLADQLGDLNNHQQLNFALRAALIKQDGIPGEFILSDDDARPIRPIPESIYYENGRHHPYYFYDLSRWGSKKTDFDLGQHNTFKVLAEAAYPHLSYASHMPQIIDRECFLACLDRFDGAYNNLAICEWSLYFNFSRKIFPRRFHPPQPYLTFCWPDAPYTWPLFVEPDAIYFENYYPQMYELFGMFCGYSAAPGTDEAGRVAEQKNRQWQLVADARLKGRPLLCDPWVQGSWVRWLAASVVWPIYFRNRRL